MLITILLGLYASRLILNALGVSDYGIYNVIGGVVVMASFLNSGLTAASQRFLSFALGKNEKKYLEDVFSTSISIHLCIAIITFVIAETVGLWFINTHLNIDPQRMTAANWVYQFSVFSFILTIVSVPYNSCIVAHEHMAAFAYISILEAVLKLGIVFCLFIGTFDKLILYGALVLLVALIVRLCYGIYCKRHFEECLYRLSFHKDLFREMIAFSGWSMVGQLGFVGREQGSNIILNIFFGTTINAARGIAINVSNMVNGFSNNFIMSLYPPITKNYAKGNIAECKKMVISGCRMSFYLLSIITIPFILNVDYVLKLWLGLVPTYTSTFLVYTLLAAVIYSMSQPVTIAIQSTGKVRTFQIGVCVILFMELPLVWIMMKRGFPPYLAMLPTLASNLVCVFFRFFLLKRYINAFSWREYLFSVVLRCTIVFAVCYYVNLKIWSYFPTSFVSLIATSAISILVSCYIIYATGLTQSERLIVHKLACSTLRKIKCLK